MDCYLVKSARAGKALVLQLVMADNGECIFYFLKWEHTALQEHMEKTHKAYPTLAEAAEEFDSVIMAMYASQGV